MKLITAEIAKIITAEIDSPNPSTSDEGQRISATLYADGEPLRTVNDLACHCSARDFLDSFEMIVGRYRAGWWTLLDSYEYLSKDNKRRVCDTWMYKQYEETTRETPPIF